MKNTAIQIKSISPNFIPNNNQLVGKKPKVINLILGTSFIVLLALFALFVTGLGYLPWWIFIIVLVLGLGITLPACFNDYWMIDQKQLFHFLSLTWRVLNIEK